MIIKDTDNDYFVYYNINPLGLSEQDCVIRAISLATGIDYLQVIYMLLQNGDFYSCDELCICCYQHLLDNYFNFEKIQCDGINAKELAHVFPYGVFLIRMNGHLSCMINGKVYDIWNCSNETLTDIWKVK